MPISRRTPASPFARTSSAAGTSSPTATRSRRRTSRSGSATAGSCTRQSEMTRTASSRKQSPMSCEVSEDGLSVYRHLGTNCGPASNVLVTIKADSDQRRPPSRGRISRRWSYVTLRNRWARWTSVAVLVAAVSLLAAACGGGGSKNSEGTTTSTTSSGGSSQQKTFANFRVVYDTGTDYLDPAYSYTVEGWEIMWNVYLGLLGYKHVNGPDGATIVPALAKDLPQISSDGKTYTLTLRSGLKYSDGTPVKASDFKYAIKRDFLADSPGVGFFTNIVGADEFSKTKKGDISGITADDATGKITIKLTKPQGDFQNILATTFAAPVPQGTSSKDQSSKPIPSTGPYQIQSYSANRQAVMIRNPNFQPTDNIPATNPDKITIKIVEDDSAALQQVINGQADYDFHPIPVDRLAEVQQKYGDQLKIYTPANTYYFFMNTRTPPFDKLAVRKAVNYAIDRNALVRLYGGLATPTENILPPTYPQYKKHNLYPFDLQKAKQLIEQAGATGTEVQIWGSNRETSQKPV